MRQAEGIEEHEKMVEINAAVDEFVCLPDLTDLRGALFDAIDNSGNQQGAVLLRPV